VPLRPNDHEKSEAPEFVGNKIQPATEALLYLTTARTVRPGRVIRERDAAGLVERVAAVEDSVFLLLSVVVPVVGLLPPLPA
jgi:hypothetical protein